MLRTLYKSLIFITLILFTTACSDSKPDKLIESYTNDFNSSTLPLDKAIQINVYENYSDGESADASDSLIWETSDSSLASVQNGLVQTYLKEGLVEISYETSTKLNNSSPVHKNILYINVKDLALQEIKLSLNSLDTFVNSSNTVKAMGTYEENQTYDITNDVEWLSSDTDICSVTKGVITCSAEGNVSISCMDDNISSDELLVNVSVPLYSKIEISSEKTTFNAEQTITLEVKATTSTGEIISLDNSELDWHNYNSQIVEFDSDTAIATALSHGDANISVSLSADSSYEDSILLSVDKEEYMRLFRGDTEIEFPFSDLNESDTIAEELETFSMIAVGRDFIVSELKVSDFYGTYSTYGYFDNLINYETIAQDENRTFELKYTGEPIQLHYYFKINDDYINDFSMKYSIEEE